MIPIKITKFTAQSFHLKKIIINKRKPESKVSCWAYNQPTHYAGQKQLVNNVGCQETQHSQEMNCNTPNYYQYYLSMFMTSLVKADSCLSRSI